MAQTIQVPNLPGFVSNDTEKESYAKPQTFNIVDGLPVLENKKKNQLKPSQLKTIPTDKKYYGERKIITDLSAPRTYPTVNALPEWVAYDRKVLRFWCHVSENIIFSNEESLRYRHFIIYYYLEDDTIHMSEQRVENSGIPQGIFLKRQKVPLQGEDRFIQWTDIKIGETLSFFGRNFNVSCCDAHTRNFYESRGITLMEDEKLPVDGYSLKREAQNDIPEPDTTISGYLEARCGKTHSWQFQKERQFLAHDRKVLRFWAVWNDPSVYGQLHRYEVNYFLADDTLAVYEAYPENAGVNPFPAFLRRTKLPKDLPNHGVALIGVDHEDDIPYVTHEDLRVGGYLTVYGRHMLLIRADEYTIAFYKDIYNIPEEDFEPIIEEEYEYKIPEIPTPPHNGYGTEEDSMSSVKYLIPRPPRKDFHKLLKFDSTVLRFKAKLNSICKQDEGRRFVIEFFRSDDSLKIYECRCSNSGFLGGKFLERSRLKNPDTGKYFEPTEFFVGCELTINGFSFKFIEADESTLSHMEGDCENFAMANPEKILKRLADKLWDRNSRRTDTFRLIDTNHDSKITVGEFNEMMKMYGWNLNEHELLTLWRRYDVNNKGFIKCAEFFKVLETYKHGN